MNPADVIRRLIERAKREAPAPANEAELEILRLTQWTDADQFTIYREGDEIPE